MFEEEIASINIELRHKERDLNNIRSYAKFFSYLYKEDEKTNWQTLIISGIVYIGIIALRSLIINPTLQFVHSTIVALGLFYIFMYYWHSNRIDGIKVEIRQLQKVKEDYEYEIKRPKKRGK